MTDNGNKVSPIDLLKASFNRNCPCFESRDFQGKKHCANVRYLLVMTEEYSALPIIEEMYLIDHDDVSVIFGSSFPKDQEFAQVTVKHNCQYLKRTSHILAGIGPMEDSKCFFKVPNCHAVFICFLVTRLL